LCFASCVLSSFPTRRSSDLLVSFVLFFVCGTIRTHRQIGYSPYINLCGRHATARQDYPESERKAFTFCLSRHPADRGPRTKNGRDRKSTRLNSSHRTISYAV